MAFTIRTTQKGFSLLTVTFPNSYDTYRTFSATTHVKARWLYRLLFISQVAYFLDFALTK